MTTLHTFGCSITQGYALPDVVQPLLDENGNKLTEEQVLELGDSFDWNEIHLYQKHVLLLYFQYNVLLPYRN